MYRARRRGALLVAALGVVVACSLFRPASRLLDGRARIPDGRQGPLLSQTHLADRSAVSWPQQGQAALALGNGTPAAASPDEQPVPIASVAKVITAYLVLKHYPLSSTQDGFVITVTATDAQALAQDRAEGQSVVAVAPGEQLTERQLLEGLLIASGNNIAEWLATAVAGSQTRFVAEMNAQARTLGMTRTTYTDPSGFDQDTVSTAADQLRVFQQAMRFPTFRQIVSMKDVTLPVAGTLRNFNPLAFDGYAGKTGSDSTAGGCLAFFTDVTVGGRRQTAVGVVLGQGRGSDTQALLAAAGQAAQQLVDSATSTTGARPTAPPSSAGDGAGLPGGRHRHPLSPGTPFDTPLMFNALRFQEKT